VWRQGAGLTATVTKVDMLITSNLRENNRVRCLHIALAKTLPQEVTTGILAQLRGMS
jgi:hypothetical protein